MKTLRLYVTMPGRPASARPEIADSRGSVAQTVKVVTARGQKRDDLIDVDRLAGDDARDSPAGFRSRWPNHWHSRGTGHFAQG